VRRELYIKIAIVILGGFFAVTAAARLGLASSLILRGVAAIVEAYLDLVGGGLLRSAQVVRLQPRMVGAACLRHLDLRRLSGWLVFAGRDIRRD